MSTSRQERQHAVAPLANRVEGSAGALQIAAVLAGFCQEIDAALTPILGPRGVSALHVRSLHVCSRRHGWVLGPGGIAGMSGGAPHASAVDTLLAWLAMRSPTEALESGDAYLQTFHDLLVTLIGSSLTERLLRTVWPSISSGTPAQDTPQ